MASHRKPKPHPVAVPTVRAAFTLALATLAGATHFQGSGHAQPGPGPQTEPPPRPGQPSGRAAVEAEIDRLHRDAERVTESYNSAREKARAAQRTLDSLGDQAARRQEKLNASRDALGSHAAAQYRDGSGIAPVLRLALSSEPEDYLEHASVAERAGDRRAALVKRTVARTRQLAQVRKEAAGVSAELQEAADSARRHKRTVEGKLRRAQQLLSRLTPEQRAAVLDEHGGAAHDRPRDGRASRSGGDRDGGPAAHTPGRGAPAGQTPDGQTPTPENPAGQAPTERSARAVAFARGALGKPYVWGGTGPSGYDCSGLTQAAWKAAGVSLPRTSYSQIHAGKRVSRGELAPGDLVFFYDSVSHVGLYIGGGRMIHAPRPGTAVRVAPIDQMPYAGAVRPA
ncbi:C40 family peptidase [Streptomyces sp. A73]|uniref:C40 family peptidase n=1 Tax=Streptomyces sp. B15 TaxID=1537797 RepID=UPI001B37B06A|nr:NlpC/P60 family protein [Streptomyces sp. B15]MBQ1121239.1 C40 family peptidase [Streptomyces sp. B15]MBQ1161544.1 C40 family peptidase [Streptomyces sp. A73]